jgi:MOSC domain-containing protein YiiM
MKVVSVNVGRPRPNPWKEMSLTGIDKQPVDGPVLVTPARAKGLGMVGLAGDRVYDVRNHGGPDQAVYAYAREDLDGWEAELGRPLPNGVFGENLTTEGAAVNGALIGERWRVGPDVILEVSCPRIPCGTFQGWLAQAGWIKRFTQAARPGAYFRVIASGEIRAGDPVEVVHRPEHDVTIAVCFRALTLEPDLLPRLRDVGALPADLRELAVRRTIRVGQLPEVLQRGGEQVVFGGAGVEPADAGVAAEPGLLAAGEALGGLDRLGPRVVEGVLAVQVAQQLLVAERAARGDAFAQALVGQAPDLGFEARLPHPVGPGGDPQVEFGPGQREAELNGRADLTRRRIGRHGGGERAAGDLDHLKRPHDPARVARQDRGGRVRVERGQPGVQRGGAQAGQLFGEAGAGSGVRSGKMKIVQGRADVQARAADQHRHPAAGRDVVDRGAGQFLVVGHVRGLGHRPDVEQVVRYPLPRGFRLLGRADVHARVELHRVGVHDLAAQRAGQRDAQPGLAGGGRPDHRDDVRAHAPSVPVAAGARRRQLATK